MKGVVTLPARIEIYVDDATVPTQVLIAPPFQISLDTTTLPNGEHTLRVVTRFTGGRSRERRVGIVVCNEEVPLPKVVVEGLADGGRVTGVIHATVTAQAPAPIERSRSAMALYPLVIAAALAGVWAVFALTGPLLPPFGTGTATNTAPSAAPALTGAGTASPPGGGGASKAGAVLFQVQGCVGCHMVGGKGGTVGPDLTHIGATLSRAQLSATITHGKGQMPAFPTMKPADLNALLDYLQSLK